jgi:hypothetical protein
MAMGDYAGGLACRSSLSRGPARTARVERGVSGTKAAHLATLDCREASKATGAA